MNFPAIAKQTYEKLRGQPAYAAITQFVIDHFKKLSSPVEKARFIHDIVDDCNREIFAHPTVQKFLPCKAGCSGCCHTQVGITEDEAALLAERVYEGANINLTLLQTQVSVGNSPDNFYKLSYENRRCVFLGSDETCQVYNDRPSVCRTNAVLGDASQCSPQNNTSVDDVQSIRLLKTERADMAIMGSFLMSKDNGTLPHMLGKILFKTNKKSVFKDFEL